MASAAQPAADGGDGAGAGAGDDSGNDFHKIKQISFFGRKAPIIMQNENGPCPLIGIGARAC